MPVHRLPALAALALLAAGCGPPWAGSDGWPTFRGGPRRCGTAGPAEGALSPKLLWKFQEEQLLERRPFVSSPAVAGSRIVVGSDSFSIYCLDLGTGRAKWKFEAQWPVFSSPAVWRGRVYVGEGLHDNVDCNLYCLDLATGKPLWTLHTASHTESSPTVADGRVYFGAGDDGIWCADAATGRVVWRHKGVHVDSAPLVVGGRLYVGSGYGFKGILCLDARDGSQVWKRALPAAAWAAPSFADGRLYVALSNGDFTASAEKPYGDVRCIDPATGEDLWRFAGVKDGVLTSVAVAGGRAVFASRDGACYAVDARTGSPLWRTDLGAPILSSPAVTGGCVLLGADDGKFHCLRLADGQPLWSVDTSDDMLVFLGDARIQSSPTVVGGRVIFGSSNGSFYCLGEAR